MSAAARLALVDGGDPVLSMVAHCRLLKVARSTLYYRAAPDYRAAPVSADDLAVMRRMDELRWTPSVGQESGSLKRESRRVSNAPPDPRG